MMLTAELRKDTRTMSVDSSRFDAEGFDFVVVGSGSAGSVVARRLLERTDATVLVLEAGGSDADIDRITDPRQWVTNIGSPNDWNYVYSPSEHLDNRPIPLAQGKIVGGSSSINAMLWARGDRAVYDNWAKSGSPGWDYDSVLPLFKELEDWEDGPNEIHGAGGPVPVERARDLHSVASALVDAGTTFGMPLLDDINVPQPLGVGPINMNVRHGERWSAWRSYLEPVLGSDRLTVLSDTRARKLLVAKGRCTGVEFVRHGRVHVVRATTEVIVSAGAVNTPRLLMMPGIGQADDLRALGIEAVADLPGVGQNLQEHPLVAGLCFEAHEALPPLNNNLEGTTAFWKSRPEIPVADLMFVSIQIPYVSAEIGQQYPVPPNAFCIAPCLMQPQSRGYLKILTAEHDGPMEIQPNMLSERPDIDALATGIEIGLDLASQPAFRKLIKSWVAPPERMTSAEVRTFLRRSCLPYFHPVGTCAMGSGPGAVVSPRLEVHGVEGLRIADASVMPEIPSANTNAPSMMIGEFTAALATQR
jgi:choline dehydrogenase